MQTILQLDKNDLFEVLESWYNRMIADTTRKAEEQVQNQLVSRQEAAKIANKSTTWLWRMEKCNYLKPVRVGGSVKYRISDIQRLINGGEKYDTK